MTMFLHSDSPMPLPPAFDDEKPSNRRPCASVATPGPLSMT
jgi:hypothetical protein